MDGEADSYLVEDALIQAQRVVGQRLRALRLDRRMSQSDVAHHAGVHQSEWSRLEAGDIDPRLSWLLRAQELFGVESLESLFGVLPSHLLLAVDAEHPPTSGLTR